MHKKTLTSVDQMCENQWDQHRAYTVVLFGISWIYFHHMFWITNNICDTLHLRWSETKKLKSFIIDKFFSCHLTVMKFCTVIELGNT